MYVNFTRETVNNVYYIWVLIAFRFASIWFENYVFQRRSGCRRTRAVAERAARTRTKDRTCRAATRWCIRWRRPAWTRRYSCRYSLRSRSTRTWSKANRPRSRVARRTRSPCTFGATATAWTTRPWRRWSRTLWTRRPVSGTWRPSWTSPETTWRNTSASTTTSVSAWRGRRAAKSSADRPMSSWHVSWRIDFQTRSPFRVNDRFIVFYRNYYIIFYFFILIAFLYHKLHVYQWWPRFP